MEEETTTVMITKKSSIMLGELAQANMRSKSAQLEWMIEMATKQYADQKASGMEMSTRVKSPRETTARGDAAKKKLRIARAKKLESGNGE